MGTRIPRHKVDEARWRAAHLFDMRCPLCGGIVGRYDCPHRLDAGELADLFRRLPHLTRDALDDGVDLVLLAGGLQPWQDLPPAAWLMPARALLPQPGVLAAVSESRSGGFDGSPEFLSICEVPVATAAVRASLAPDAQELLVRLDALSPTYHRRLAHLATAPFYSMHGVTVALKGLVPAQAERLLALALTGDVAARKAIELVWEAVRPLHRPINAIEQLIVGTQGVARAVLPPDACARLLALAAVHPDPAVRAKAHRVASLLAGAGR